MKSKKKPRGAKVGGVKGIPFLKNNLLNQNKEKEWKFTLDPWHELPDINVFVGSTFIINRIDTQRTESGVFKYDIYIAPLPEQIGLSALYPSIMDVCESNNKARQKRAKTSSKESKNKTKTKR